MVKNDYKKILIWGAKSKARIIQKMLGDMGERVSFLYDSYLDYPEFETNAQFSNSKKDLKKFINQSTHFIVSIGGEYGMARYLISQQLIDSNLEPIGFWCFILTFFSPFYSLVKLLICFCII